MSKLWVIDISNKESLSAGRMPAPQEFLEMCNESIAQIINHPLPTIYYQIPKLNIDTGAGIISPRKSSSCTKSK
ncbi:hypothetical protein [Floridanema aerugineum]|uniref:Uncharacterized protein n=1 Tax=Floridaenema aerugineum BLCC-F46 TaxID=3153654 RepID=A0ABV4XEW5_9CYAN